MAIKAEPDLIQKRRDTCNACEHRKPATPFKPWEHCGQCGCFIAAKTALAGQSCPLKKW